jgi:hypothetical protein
MGILHHVFRSGVIAQDRAGDTLEPLVVPAHDQLVQRGIAGFHPIHDFLVGRAFGRSFIQSSNRFHGSVSIESQQKERIHSHIE